MSGEAMGRRSERSPIDPVAWCLGGAALVVLVAFTFAPVTGFGFVTWDDPGYVLKNRNVQDGLSWSGVLHRSAVCCVVAKFAAVARPWGGRWAAERGVPV